MRFFQFRLGALLLVVTVASLCLAFWQSSIAPFQQQKGAIAKLQELGASITTRPANPYWMEKFVGKEDFVRVDAIAFASAPIKNEDLGKLREIEGLRKLIIQYCPITDDGLAQLRGIESLEELTLNNTQISNDALRHIAQIRSLKSLDLRRTSITNEGLVHLARLVELESLILPRNITADALPMIARLPRLKHLDLSSTPISHEHIPQLASCPLEEPPVLSRHYDSRHIPLLAKLPSLQRVSIYGGLTKPQAKQLASLRKLTELSILGEASADCLPVLAELPNLATLQIYHSRFDDQEMRILADDFNLSSLTLHSQKLKPESVQHLDRCRSLSELSLAGPWFHENAIDQLFIDFDYLDVLEITPTAEWRRNQAGEVVAFNLSRLPIESADLAYLQQFPELQEVRFERCQIDSEDRRFFQPLAALNQLRHLSLTRTNLRSNQLVFLTDMPYLESVTLDSTHVDDEAPKYLAQMPRLKVARLGDSYITDRGFGMLRQAPSLEVIYISSRILSADALKHLKEMPRLREFYTYGGTTGVESNPLSPAALLKIKAELPHVKVYIPYAYMEYDNENHITVMGGHDDPFNGWNELALLPYLTEVRMQAFNYGQRFRNLTAQAERLQAVAKVPNLKKLLWNETAVSSEAFETLAEMQGLELLYLNNGAVKTDALPHIGKLKNLIHLGFNNDGNFRESFQGDDFEPLRSLTKVEIFEIGGVGIDGDVLEIVASWPELKSVTLRNCGLSPGELNALEAAPKLKTLHLSGVVVESADIQQFRRNRPDVEIQQ